MFFLSRLVLVGVDEMIIKIMGFLILLLVEIFGFNLIV